MIPAAEASQLSDTCDAPPGSHRAATITALVSAALVWTASLAVGLASGTVFAVAPVDPDHHPWPLAWQILTTNAAVALGLIAGVVTLGTASLIGSFVVGTYTGAVWHACWYATGFSSTLSRLAPFFAFELAGLFCATVAGLLPITAVFAGHRRSAADGRSRAWARNYLDGMGYAARWLLPVVVLLPIAAFLEILQGVPR